MTGPRVAMLRRSAHIALDRPRRAAWTFLVATCAFVIGGAAMLLGAGAGTLGRVRSSGGSMVLYLGDSIGETAGQQLTAQLATIPGVLHAELVPAAESATRLAQALAAEAALLEGIDLASLPASIEVELAPGARDVIAISPAMRALRDAPGVVDVVVEADDRDTDPSAIQRLAAGVERGAIVVAALALLMAIGVMRVWLERDRDAYRVFNLLGASSGFTWGPSVLAGALIGGVAAACAAVALAVGVAWYGPAIAAALAPVGAMEIAFPSGMTVLGCIAIGASVGVAAGWLAGDSRDGR